MGVRILDKFLALPAEKQNVIVDAALVAFGTNGYRKTSISDIAGTAGISKAMVFHYFGTKKNLYIHLVKLCADILISEIKAKFDDTVTDFFDRIKDVTEIEIAVMKKHPGILSFLASAYFEEAPEVKEDFKAFYAQGEGFRQKITFDEIDTSRFKDGIDPKLVMKMLTLCAEGFSRSTNISVQEIENFHQEFVAIVNMLRNNFYREECL